MSVEIMTDVFKAEIPSSSAKFVLVAMANCARNDTREAYPSTAYICDVTGLDRKTVLSSIQKLIGWGLICATGEKSGRTKQIHVYRISADLTVPKTEQFQKRNSPKFPVKQSQISAETVPKTGHGTVRNRKEPLSTRAQERFEQFWAAYPKKVGKGAAQKSWKQIKPDSDLSNAIIKAVLQQKSSEQWRRNNGQFIPNPATWLNQQRWLDDTNIEIGRSNDPYSIGMMQ